MGHLERDEFAGHVSAALSACVDAGAWRCSDAAALAQQPRETIALARHRGEHLAFRRGDPAAAIAHGEEALQQLDASDTAPLDADAYAAANTTANADADATADADDAADDADANTDALDEV